MQQFRMLAENIRYQVRRAGLDATQRHRDMHDRSHIPQSRATFD